MKYDRRLFVDTALDWERKPVPRIDAWKDKDLPTGYRVKLFIKNYLYYNLLFAYYEASHYKGGERLDGGMVRYKRDTKHPRLESIFKRIGIYNP